MLMLTIVGHDPGAVTVDGHVGVLETDAVITLPAGPHAITAARVTSPQTGITSQVFEGTVDRPQACVRAGATTVATVTYKLVPTSGKLWVGVGNAPDDSTMLGFTPASLAATRTSSADVAANTGGSDGFTFDRAGNIWVLGGTTADLPLARYPAALFASDGVKVPDVTIESSSFGSSIPGPKVVAFDPAGNLWVSVVAEDKVVMFTAAQIAAGGAPTATVERRGLISPQGLAFDSAGNLWVAAHDEDAVVRIDKDHLVMSGDTEDLAITAETPPPVIGALTPISLAFDAAGTLWVNYDGTIAAIPVADQHGNGYEDDHARDSNHDRRVDAAGGHGVRPGRRPVDRACGGPVRALRFHAARRVGRGGTVDHHQQPGRRLRVVVRGVPRARLHAALSQGSVSRGATAAFGRRLNR